MAGTLASPSFVTGAKDDLAAADVYNLSSALPINKIEPLTTINVAQEQKLSALQGGKAMLDKVKNGLNVVKAVKDFNMKGGNTYTQLLSAQSGLSSVLKSLPPNLSGISGTLSQLVNATSGALKTGTGYMAQVNGVQSRFKNGTDLAKITAIGNMINSVSCDKNVFTANDRRAQVGAYAGVINIAMMSGIPGAYGAVLKCESNSGVLNQVTAACLPSTIKTSDITSLADMCNKVKPGVIKGLNPTVINDFNSTFSLPPGATSAQMKDTFSMTKDTFTKIDPNWNTGSWSGEQVTNLSCVVGSSNDFQRMMATSILSNPNATDDDHLMLAATTLAPTDVHQEIATQLPMLTTINTAPDVVSPAVAAMADSADKNTADGGVVTRTVLSNGTIKTKTTYPNGDFTTTYTPPASQPAFTAITGENPWTEDDEFGFQLINKRYGGNLKSLLRSKSFLTNEVWANRITMDERDLLARSPYA